MHSYYSPLFTWGLLADKCMGTSSRRTHAKPVDAPAPAYSGASQKTQVLADDASAFYFTLHGGRDTIEFRSFLSLDLAEHNRLKGVHRRKPSNMSKSTSWTCTSSAQPPFDMSVEPEPIANATLPVLPTLRRSSRESLRHIPSPKPAPSSSLPDVPTPSDMPSCSHSSSLSPIIPSLHRSSHSTPVISSGEFVPAPSSPRSSSLRSASISSHDRRKSRMDALACLEGRSRAAGRILPSRLRGNFMSLSEDEDDEPEVPMASPATPQIQVEDFCSFADIEDEEDAIIPSLSRKHLSPKTTSKPHQSAPVQRRKRGSTIDSWFPLKSFIDLKDDELSWNWRSFIEIGGVS
ncbi:hypothetical protein BJ138DRAFT_1082357 [Hygrophoropsis aurantiaca]|uniref:Uncharacterized protein n=1 Tax=Hygrophoropsis aurantiaca TaxID=72124 RepID=A0ACB8AJF9_9AGAM|nr:hypothetical protein BJ138DRAFT_1082357 [Hygrophoropsis aurantiaca]